MNMLKAFSVGDEIYGYCNGAFGRDDYDHKVCVMVTPEYAVFEYIKDSLYTGLKAGNATILNYDGCYKDSFEKWKLKPEEEEY